VVGPRNTDPGSSIEEHAASKCILAGLPVMPNAMANVFRLAYVDQLVPVPKKVHPRTAYSRSYFE
jgi:hypothetical protein